MNIEVEVGRKRLPADMVPEWFADQVATLVRGEEGHNVTLLVVDGDGVVVTHEGNDSASGAEKALAKAVHDAIEATIARDDYPKAGDF